VEQGHVVEDLVAVVPGVQRPVSGVVVQHGQVAVFIGQWNIDVLVGGGVGGVGVVHLGSPRVPVGDVQGPTDHEGLSSAAFGVVGGPAADDLQRVGVQLAEDDVPCVLIGGVDGPQPPLVHHEVDVGVPPPGVVVHVVVAGEVQLAGPADERRAEVEPDDRVTLELVEVNGPVVDHLTSAGPGVRQAVGSEVLRRHEVAHGLVLPHEAVVMVTVQVPHL